MLFRQTKGVLAGVSRLGKRVHCDVEKKVDKGEGKKWKHMSGEIRDNVFVSPVVFPEVMYFTFLFSLSHLNTATAMQLL